MTSNSIKTYGINYTNSISYRFGFNGKEKDNEVGQGNYDFGARMYDSRIGRWMSLDPLAIKYPYLSPYNFVGNSPIMCIDPDGKKILPINKDADDAMANLSTTYGQALGITNSKTNVYGVKNSEMSLKQVRAALKVVNSKITKTQIAEAYQLYQALADPKIIEVQVLKTGENKPSFTNKPSDNNNGTNYAGKKSMDTDNQEWSEFTAIMQNQGGTVTSTLSDVLYNGKEINIKDKSYSIISSEKGQGWVFFNNEDSKTSGKTSGLLIVDGTNKTDNQNGNSITGAAVELQSK